MSSFNLNLQIEVNLSSFGAFQGSCRHISQTAERLVVRLRVYHLENLSLLCINLPLQAILGAFNFSYFPIKLGLSLSEFTVCLIFLLLNRQKFFLNFWLDLFSVWDYLGNLVANLISLLCQALKPIDSVVGRISAARMIVLDELRISSLINVSWFFGFRWQGMQVKVKNLGHLRRLILWIISFHGVYMLIDGDWCQLRRFFNDLVVLSSLCKSATSHTSVVSLLKVYSWCQWGCLVLWWKWRLLHKFVICFDFTLCLAEFRFELLEVQSIGLWQLVIYFGHL